jgi:hypothetical protein
MVVHVLLDVAQKARSQDADRTKSDRDVVYPLVRLRISDLTGIDDHFISTGHALDARERLKLGDEGCTGDANSFCLGSAVGLWERLGSHLPVMIVELVMLSLVSITPPI